MPIEEEYVTLNYQQILKAEYYLILWTQWLSQNLENKRDSAKIAHAQTT